MDRVKSRRGTLAAALLSAVGVAVSASLAMAGGGEDATVEETAFSIDSTFGIESGDAVAKCPGKRRALGGGVVQSGYPEGEVEASGPVAPSGLHDGDRAKRWYASVENDAVGVRDFKVMAICSADSNATVEVTGFSVDSFETDSGVARCPGKRRALGGGVLSVRNTSGSFESTNDGDNATLWYAAAYNNSARDGERFKVFAICSADSNATLKATEFSVNDRKTDAEYARCPPNKRALGGGVIQSGAARRSFVRATGPLDASNEMESTDDGDVATRWYAAMANASGATKSYKVLAVCGR
jgi:hypothetical protein